MIVNVVSVWVKEGHIEAFKTATIENHQNSVKEAGNMRFDVLQSRDNPANFTLYEAYKSLEAVAAHKETAHYKKWRDTVADWMAKPREAVSNFVVAPGDVEQW